MFANLKLKKNNYPHTKNIMTPISYENKKSASFKVFQVLGNAALASEISNKQYKWHNETTVGGDMKAVPIINVN